MDDGVHGQVGGVGEYPVDALDHLVGPALERDFQRHALRTSVSPGPASPCRGRGLARVGRVCPMRRRHESGLGDVWHRALIHTSRDKLQPIQLADAHEHILPRLLEVVAFGLGEVKEDLEGLDVLGLHLSGVVEIRRVLEDGYEGLTRGREVKQTGNLGGQLHAFEAQLVDIQVVCLLDQAGQSREEGHPGRVEHGPYVLERGSLDELGPHIGGALSLAAVQVAEELFGPQRDLLGLLDVRFPLQVAPDVGEGLAEPCGKPSGLGLKCPSSSSCFPLALEHNLVLLNILVDSDEILVWKIGVVVDAAVVLDELLLGHTLHDLAAVQIRVEHDDGIRQHVRGVGVGEGVRVPCDVAVGELEHETIDLLGLAWQAERLEEFAQGIDEALLAEVHHVHKRVHDVNVLLVTLAQVLADLRLVQPVFTQEKTGQVLGLVARDEAFLDQQLDAVLRLEIEDLDRVGHGRLSGLLLFQLIRVIVDNRCGGCHWCLHPRCSLAC